jgi:hypothetical protein
MRKLIKTAVIILAIPAAVLLLAVSIKVWWFFQNKYVCEPKVRLAVDKFMSAVIVSGYETLEDKSMFTNRAQFKEIKDKISHASGYSLEIKDWGFGGEAYVIIKLPDDTAYALMVVPTEDAIFSCWGKEHKIVTIR